jgi:uncharacterized OsmC-like protein
MSEAASIRDTQKPLKQAYRAEPGRAQITLRATSSDNPGGPMACSIDIGRAVVEAQAHAGVGGGGPAACSGDLLLGSLAACAQITAQMVAASLNLPVTDIEVAVEGDLDLRGTLGVDPEVPVGFQAIRTTFTIAGTLDAGQAARLERLTERYCVVLSTLTQPPPIEVVWHTGAAPASSTLGAASS